MPIEPPVRPDHDHPDHDHPDHGDQTAMFTQGFWDTRYASADRIWSGRPNARLVAHVTGLAPGTAIDVGCGEGADAVWLASRGWQVTGVDVSQVALDRAREHATDAGVADRTAWLQVDLLAGDPLPEAADLVSAQFMHLPAAVFEEVYGAIAGAVRPGGTLLVVGHHPADASTGLRNPELTRLLFTPEQVTALLEGERWEVLVADTPTREVEVEGREVTLTDSVVMARRR